MDNTAPQITTPAWNEWNPGLDNDQMKLEDVRAGLPGASPEDISLMVRLLENPKSPLALTGAVTLERHDCIHILLGRGLLSQDEAFVIGFTMGTAKEELGDLEKFIFKNVARYLYPTNYRLTKKNLEIYELGVATGKEFGTNKIYRFPFEENYHRTLASLRMELGIDVERLKEIYREEQKIMPDTKASLRLPV